MNRSEFQNTLGLSAAQMDAFDHWKSALSHWNKRINLVGKHTLSAFWERHALDSAQVFNRAPESAKIWIDLGSGAGFPGIAMAIMGAKREGFHVHLVEANNKKASFLRQMVRELDLPATVHATRAEDISGLACDIVTARAFAPLPRLMEYAAPFWADHTIGLFLKGAQVQAEIDAAHLDFSFSHTITPSQADDAGCLLHISSLHKQEQRP